MKAYKLTAIKTFGLFEVPLPALNADEVLIKMGAVGICGSDVHYYADGKIGSQIVEYPWTVGHEGAGTVAAVGTAVTGLEPGARVAFDPAYPCGGCPQCLAGRPHTCLHLNFLGCPTQVEGCLAEYIALPRTCCYSISEPMSMEVAALAEPLSIAVYASSLSKRLLGASVGVLGCGPIGLSMVHVLKSEGVSKLFATDKIDARLAAAAKAGADWTVNPEHGDVVEELRRVWPQGLDFVFECCGQQEALDQAVKIVKPGGELSLIGIPESNRISFDINDLRRKEIRIQNVRRQNGCMRKALELIESGKVDLESMITYSFPFTETPQAFELVSQYRDGVIKSMIRFDTEN